MDFMVAHNVVNTLRPAELYTLRYVNYIPTKLLCFFLNDLFIYLTEKNVRTHTSEGAEGEGKNLRQPECGAGSHNAETVT